jgi:hypothetical protein
MNWFENFENWFDRVWESKWNYLRRLMKWDRKRTDKMREKFWEPWIEEELRGALDDQMWYDISESIEWEEVDGSDDGSDDSY